jgi:hypothetical protein
MSIFYSDGIRELIIQASYKWPKDDKLYDMLKSLLHDKYLKNEKDAVIEFNRLKPEHILTELHNRDPLKFFLNPSIRTSGQEFAYLPQFFELITGKPVFVFNYNESERNLYYATTNHIIRYDIDNKNYRVNIDEINKISIPDIRKSLETSEIFILRILNIQNMSYLVHENVHHDGDIFVINGKSYKVVSMMLHNFNKQECSLAHSIAGVTCNGKRFLYNGWMKNSIDRGNKSTTQRETACDLIPFDWLHETEDFCINLGKCRMDLKSDTTQMCFNVKKGLRIYLLVKQ